MKNGIKFRTIELHLKNGYNGSVEYNRATEKRIEEFKCISEKIIWNAMGKKKKMQNIKGKLNMIYIMGWLYMLISISERESGDNGKKAEFQVMIVESYFLSRVKEIHKLSD